jgi:hypothetical protein
MALSAALDDCFLVFLTFLVFPFVSFVPFVVNAFFLVAPLALTIIAHCSTFDAWLMIPTIPLKTPPPIGFSAMDR